MRLPLRQPVAPVIEMDLDIIYGAFFGILQGVGIQIKLVGLMFIFLPVQPIYWFGDLTGQLHSGCSVAGYHFGCQT